MEEEEDLVYTPKNTSPTNKPNKSNSSRLIYTPKKNKPIHSIARFGVDIHGNNLGVGTSDYDEGLTWGTNIDEEDLEGSINEYRANEQSGWTQLGAGILRAGTKAAIEVAKLPGVVGGIAMSPFAEEGKGYDTAFNNAWIKSLDSINEEINSEFLPVYVKKAVKEGDLWDNITSTSFWATDGADGLGFMIGMMAPGAIISKLGMGAKLLDFGRKSAQYLGMAEKTESAVNILKSIGLTGKSIDIGTGAIVNTISESGAEAKGVGDALDAKKPEYIAQHLPNIIKQLNPNNIPEMIQGPMYIVRNLDGTESMQSSGLIPNPEFEEIKKQAMEQIEVGFKEQRALAMRDTFKSNLAVLIVPNLLMSKALFGKKTDKLVSNIGKTTMQKVGTRAANIGKRYAKATASEGFLEEGSQTAIESMFVDKAIAGELKRGDNGYVTGGLEDFSIGEATEAYSDMISSTEGKKAVFLGAAIGAPMMSYQGRKEDVWRQKRSNEILTNMDNSINSFNTIFDNDIYKKDPKDPEKFLYKKDQDGNDTTEREIDRSKALEVAKSLNYNERQSARLDWAIRNGKTEIIEELRESAIFDLIKPSIYNGEAGIDALKDKLANSSQFQEIISRDINDKGKNNSKEFVKNALDTAIHLQKQNDKFVDFAGDIIDLQDEKGRDTKEVKERFINHLNTQYLQVKYKQYVSENKLKEANKKKDSILEELNIHRTTDEISGNARQVSEARSKNKMLDDVFNEITSLEESIAKNNKDINELWSGKDLVNKSFSKYLDKIDAENKAQSDAKAEEADNLTKKVKKAKNKKELDDALEISTKEMDKAVQAKTIDEVNESIDSDSSIDNLQLNLNKLKELGLSSKKINKIIDKVEGLLAEKMQEIEDFKLFLEEALLDYNTKSEEILISILNTEAKINELVSSRELLKKTLDSQDKSPRGRNAKLLKELIKETKEELERVEKELTSLIIEKENLTKELSVADKEINYILTRYNQVEKERFTSIKDIIDYLERNKKYFSNEHRHNLSKLLVNQFATEKEIELIENSISSLENYIVVLNQTIRNLLDSEENHSEDLYYLQEQLNDSKEELVEYKKTLQPLKEKLGRLNDAIDTKEGLDLLNKEIEFWEKFQKFKEEQANELLNNPVIQEIVNKKEAELSKKELKAKKAEEKKQRKLKEIESLNETPETEIVEPEIIVEDNGEFVSESVPEEENSESFNEITSKETSEQKKKIEKDESNIKAGTKIISTNQKTGEAIYPNLQQFVDYEKEPRDKSNDLFTFDTDVAFMSKEVADIYNKVLKGVSVSEKDIKTLEDHLPIKVLVSYTTKDEQGDLVDRQTFSFIETKTEAIVKNETSLGIYNEQNAPIRKKIIKHLVANKSFEGLSTNLHSQFPGVLKIDTLLEDGSVKKNDIFSLDVFKNMSEEEKIEYFQRNTAYVNISGELLSTLGGRKRIKMMSPDNRGKVFLRIPRLNGEDYWLKLNIDRINYSKAEAVYEMVKALSSVSESVGGKVLTNMSIEQFFDMLDESDPALSNRIQSTLEEEIDLINSFDKGKIGNRSLSRFLDLIVYHKSNNQKTAFNLRPDGTLILGSLAVQLMDGSGFENKLQITKGELQTDQAKDIIIEYLQAKRYNVLITKDSANLFIFNNKEYVKYLLGINSGFPILSTNAVVEEATFGGYSNMYINQNVSSDVKTEAKKQVKKKPVTKSVVKKDVKSKITDVEVISDITYKVFKDNKHVSDKILNEIAKKKHNDEALSPRENEFYEAHKEYVDDEVTILGNKPVELVTDESGAVIDTKSRFANRNLAKTDVDLIVKTYNSTNEDGKIVILDQLSEKIDETIDMDLLDKKGADFVFKELIKIARTRKLSIEDIDKICSI